MSEALLKEYDDNLELYKVFAAKVHALLADIVPNQIRGIHSLSVRVKSRDSLAEKIAREGKTYKSLSDITDIVGVRIITYLADDVDRVARLVEQEFDVDKAHSIDKRTTIDADRFGYLSLHHVVCLSANRLKLTEYKRFPKLRAEIQTRSILQHAWAEIEHDLGYKSRLAVPAILRRRFFRLAGLLELADQEFGGIRAQLLEYESSVGARIAAAPQDVLLDSASLRSYIRGSNRVQRLDREIAKRTKSKLSGRVTVTSKDLENLVRLGLTTVQQVDNALRSREDIVVDFAARWIGDELDPDGSFSPGISLFYLWYVMLAETRNRDEIVPALQAWHPRADESLHEWAEEVLTAYSDISPAKS